MHNKVLTGFLVFFCFVSNVFCGEPDKELELKCLRPTVKVMNERGGGTGTIIKSYKISDKQYLNAVLTCHHVTQNMDTALIATIGYKDFSIIDPDSSQVYPAYVYLEDPHADMAIVLFTSETPMPVAELGFKEKIYISNDIVSFGCALREYPRFDWGKITGIYNNIYRTQLNAIPGDSGGGVYHSYKLIAIKMAYSCTNTGDGSVLHLINVSRCVSINNLILWAASDSRVKESYDEKTEMSELSFNMASGAQFNEPISLIDFFLQQH